MDLRKTLYIVRRTSSLNDPFLIPGQAADKEVSSILLIQNAVLQPPLGRDRVYALTDGTASSPVPSSVASVSYQDMVRMIFESDTVTVLSLSSVLISGLVA
jgi:hypothetical protein